MFYEFIFAFFTGWSGVFIAVTVTIFYRKNTQARLVSAERKKLEISIKDKDKKNASCISLRPMDLMSEIWHRMYEDHESPIIHGFEFIPNHPFDVFVKVWQTMCEEYIDFRSIPVKIGTHYYWKEVSISDIDLNYHIRHIQIDEVIDNLDDKNPKHHSMKHLLANKVNQAQMNRNFDPNRPHWEAYYYTFSKHPKVAYGEIRMHHAMTDGILMSRILESHHGSLWPNEKDKDKDNEKNNCKDSKQNEKLTENSKTKEKDISNDAYVTKSKTKYKKNRHPSIIKILLNLPWSLYDYFVCFLLFGTLPAIPLTIDNKYNKHDSLSHECICGITHTLPLNEVKRLAKRYNGTINDLTATLFCSAINIFLKQKMKCTDYKSLIASNNNKFYLRFVSVFDMRLIKANNKEFNDIALEAKTGSKNNNSNNLALVPIPLPCGEMSFSERFNEIQNIFNHLKYGPTPLLSVYVIKLINLIGGPDLVVRFFKFQYAKCLCMWSNFAGPRWFLPYRNDRILGNKNNGNGDREHAMNVFALSNTTGVGIGCTVMSYANEITFSLVVDKNIMDKDQLNKLVDTVNDQFVTLSGLLPVYEE